MTTLAPQSQPSPALIALDAEGFMRRCEQLLAASQDPDRARAAVRAAGAACCDQLQARWQAAQQQDAARAGDVRRVHYLSMEFLMGRALSNALAALGLTDALGIWLAGHGLTLADVLESEPDAALGNGGLGRLAACFLDSFAELGLPSFGYGLRYEFGMFAQHIEGGQQKEVPDAWLVQGTPWDVERHGLRHAVGFGGHVEVMADGRRAWVPATVVWAQAHDFIVPAHASARVSTLRQWRAQAVQPLDFATFCTGRHADAARAKVDAEALNWVLYPDDSTDAGRELRLKQEAFLVSASVQDAVARHLAEGGELRAFGRRNVLHLNDTHPALTPAELMRVLLDDHGLGWDEAWQVTTEAVSYTNHTLMPEALETWPLDLFARLLPRHLEIIFEINHRFLSWVRSVRPGDEALVPRVSLIDEEGGRRVRMAALSIVASHHVNGVAALHSKLMVQTIFRDYASLWPQRFLNVTNGVTPRRWVAQANPALASLFDAEVGEGWRHDAMALRQLTAKAGDARLGEALAAIKHANKVKLAARVQAATGQVIDPTALFDVQIKRIHEYKRQLLNLLHVAARYQAIVADPGRDWQPRVVLIGGKAASAYRMAKLIIRLAHDLSATLAQDARVAGRLQLVFVPNYSVSWAEQLMPAADLSEQISTAGTEASGTGNMKFSLNGALTIGTWDGANIEMAQAMGEENMFVFGLKAEEVEARRAGYRGSDAIAASPRLAAVVQALARGDFSPGEPGRYAEIVEELTGRDRYFLGADFDSYWQAQQQVDALYQQPGAWRERVVRNIAGMGFFSSDRTIRQYVDQVWSAQALPVQEA